MKKLDVCRATLYRTATLDELDLVKIGKPATRVTGAASSTLAAGKAKS